MLGYGNIPEDEDEARLLAQKQNQDVLAYVHQNTINFAS